MKFKILFWFIVVFMLSSSVMGALTDGLIQYYSATNGVLTADVGKTYTKLGTPSNVTGFFNQAYNFTAIDQRFNHSANAQTTNTTVSVWVNKHGIGGWTTAGYNAIVASSSNGAWAAGDWAIMTRGTATENLTVNLNTGGGLFTYGSVLSNNSWNHILVIIDGTAGTCKLYLNGVLQSTLTDANIIRAWPTLNYLAIWSIRNNDWFQGTIDEFAQWNRTLNATEISNMYNSGAGFAYPFDYLFPTIDNSTYNLTSASSGQNSTAWRNGNEATSILTIDTTPTVTFNTIQNAYCRINKEDQNWTTMGTSRNCSTTGTNSHVCTLAAGDALVSSSDKLFIACIDGTLNVETESSTSGLLNITLGSIPEVTIISPENDTIANENIQWAYINATDNIYATLNCSLLINGTIYNTNDSVLNNTPTNISSNTTLSDGYYYFWVACINDGITGTSLNYSITKDTNAPYFENAKNTSNDTFKYNSSLITNITITDTIGNISYYIFASNISGIMTNSSSVINNTAASINVSVTSILNITHKPEVCWKFWANDSNFGHSNESEEYCIQMTDTLPVVTNVNITPTTAYYDTVLIPNYTITDVDEDAETDSYFTWFINDVYNSSGLANSTNITTLTNVRKDSMVIIQITPQNGTHNGTAINSSAIRILNSLAVVNTSRILPDPAYTNSSLTGYCNATDVDGDIIDWFYYEWFNDDGLNSSGSINYTSIGNYTYDNFDDSVVNTTLWGDAPVGTSTLSEGLNVLNSSVVNPGGDGASTILGGVKQLISFTTLSNAPDAINVTIKNMTVLAAAVLNSNSYAYTQISNGTDNICAMGGIALCSGTPGCSVQYLVDYIDLLIVINTTADTVYVYNNTDELLCADTLSGDIYIQTEQQADDGGSDGSGSTRVTFAEVNYTSKLPFQESVEYAINTISSQAVDTNWTFSCLASNITANSSWLNSSVVTVYPTNPILVSAPEFNLTTVYTNSYLGANTSYYNYYSRLGNITFFWYINDTYIFSESFNNTVAGTILNSSLDNSYFSKTDKINVSVQAIDELFSSPYNYSEQITVSNSVPNVTIVNMTNNTATTNNTLSVDFEADDIDSDILNCSIFVNGTNYGFNDSVDVSVYSTLVANSTIDDGQWAFWINCSDGTDSANSQNMTIIIDNNPPSLVINSPANETAYANTSYEVVFNYTASDAYSFGNCTLYINNNSNTTNTSSGNATFTLLLTTGTYYWYINCTDTSGNINYSAERILGLFTLVFKIEDYNTTKKWEMFTTPIINLSSDGYASTFCIDISLKDYGINYTCGTLPLYYNFTIPYVETTEFSTGVSEINITDNGTFEFNTKNWSELTGVTVDIYAYDTTLDTTLDSDNDNNTQVTFRGYLNNNTLVENRWYDNTTTLTDVDFTATSTYTTYIRLSSAASMQDNITFWVNATASNPIELDYLELWYNDSYFDDTNNGSYYSTSLPTFVFDDMTSDVSGRWNYNEGGEGIAEWDSNETIYTLSSATAYSDGSYIDTAQQYAHLNSKGLDFNTKTRVDIYYNMSCSAYGYESNGCWGNFGSGIGIASINLVTNAAGTLPNTEVISLSCYGSSSSTSSGVLSFRYNASDITQLYVYKDGVFLKTVANPGSGTNIKGYSFGYADGYGADCGFGGGTGVGYVYFYQINYSGAGINYSQTDNHWLDNQTSAEAFSDIILSSDEDIVNVYPDFSELQPAGSDVRLYVSADNGTNWQEATDESFLTFSNPGKYLRYKINMTNTQTELPVGMYYVDLQVSSDSVSDLGVKVGTNISYQFNVSGDLNNSTTPTVVTLDSDIFNNYLQSSTCNTTTTCDVPIIFDILSTSKGYLTFWNLTATGTLADVSLNYSSFNLSNCSTEDCNKSIAVNNSNTTIQFSDLRVKYRGTGNITITGHNDEYSESQTMMIYYSPFSVEFVPTGITYMLFNPMSSSQKNVSPHGQVMSRFKNLSIQNVSSSAFDHNIDLYLQTNATDGYINTTNMTNSTTMYIMNQTTKLASSTVVLNYSRQAFMQNVTNSSEYPVYILADFYNVSGRPYYAWWNWWTSYCSDSGDGYGGCVVID
ncbi:MAG: LamG domain-containing protein [Candidatus Paceibacterota bacterium]